MAVPVCRIIFTTPDPGDMGVMEYAKIDVEKLIGNDMEVAEEFDAKRFVKQAIAAE